MIFYDAPQYSEIFHNILANIFHNLSQFFTIFHNISQIFTIFYIISQYSMIFKKSQYFTNHTH